MLSFATFIRQSNKGAIVHCISTTTSIRERCAMYKKQGLFICYSARPILMDILHKRISIHDIQGACLLNAQKLLGDAFYIETFFLYMLHTRGDGYICATSESPGEFLGPGKLAGAMSSLFFCKDVQFYPRFHVSLKEYLDTRQPDVVEIRIPLTSLMRQLQNIFFSILSEMLRELTNQMEKMGFKELQLPSVESLLDGTFFKLIHNKITRPKRKLSLQRGFRKVDAVQRTMNSLTEVIDAWKKFHFLDPVSFAVFCERLVNTSKRDGIDVSPWLYTKQAQYLVPTAMAYKSEYISKNRSQNSATTTTTTKEHVIRKILAKAKVENKRVLLLLKSWVSSEAIDLSFCNMENIDSILQSAVYLTFQHFHDCPSLCGIVNELPMDLGWKLPKTTLRSQDATIIKGEEALTVDCKVQQLYEKSNQVEDEFDWIILCGIDLKSIRRVELFQALMSMYCTKKLKIYLLSYDGSIEQSVYLNEMKNERDSFKELVTTKANLVFSLSNTIKPDEQADGHTNSSSPESSLLASHVMFEATHIDKEKVTASCVIVDEREFRSSLPFQLIKQENAHIIPRTLWCGDYILSDSVIVERKSSADLESSLYDGRLLSQLSTMQRSYSVCILLIESGSTYASDYELVDADHTENAVNEKKPSAKQAASKILSDSRIIERMCAVSKCFPRLRFLWSDSDQESVMLFMEIKKDRLEPSIPADLGIVINKDPKKNKEEALLGTLKKGIETDCAKEQLKIKRSENLPPEIFEDPYEESSYSESLIPYATQILLHLPGVNHNNVRKLTQKYESLIAVGKTSLSCLQDTLGDHNAALLYNALHKSLF